MQNLLNSAPPLVLNTAAGSGIRFDPSNANPIGRLVQFQITKRW